MTLPAMKSPEPSAPPETRRYFRFRPTAGFFAHLFKAVFKQHHREDLPWLKRVIPENGVVFDVGAHAGQFAKLFAGIAKDGFVYSFEPGTYARTILRSALFLNRVRNVAVLPLALGSRMGLGWLNIPVKKSGSYGFGLSHIGASDKGETESEIISIATLDEMAAMLNISRLDFIKADIEGFEARLIEGAKETLKRFRPALYLEMEDRFLARAGDTLEGAWNAITALGYRPFEAREPRIPIAAPRNGDVLWLARE